MVYRLTLSYRGTAYAGWQRQANARTVQQTVEEAVADLLGQPLRITGASRTDAGVHARGQAAHLELDRPFPEAGLVRALNQRLPEDIRVMAARRMRTGFHALRCAAGKEYRYRLSRATVISALDSPFVVPAPRNLDLDALRRATAVLPGRHDFTAFALAGGSHQQPWRRITSAEWHEQDEELELRILGEGFLRGMVRSLVGTLLEVGRGRRSTESFAGLLQGKPRGDAGPTAPAHGLVLERVIYPPMWEEEVPAEGGEQPDMVA